MTEREGLAQHVARMNQDTKMYTDSDGVNWVSKNGLVKSFGIGRKRLMDLIGEVHTIPGLTSNGKPTLFYKEKEAEKILLSSGYTRREIRKTQASIKTRVPWKKMDPDERVRYIRVRAGEIFSESGEISQKFLQNNGESSFANAIGRYYPNGLLGLKADLGVDASKVQGYWTKERIEEEAQNLVDNHGVLSHKFLKKVGRSDLQQAIVRNYPDGINGLKRKLGVQTFDQMPKGYWTVERMEREARRFIEEEGTITVSLLDKKGRSNLGTTIVHNYPGGMTRLKLNLGIRANKPKGFWTNERIESEAREFLQKHGSLSKRLLDGNERSDLRYAIFRKYPGGIDALRESLGLQNGVSQNEARQDLQKLVEVKV